MTRWMWPFLLIGALLVVGVGIGETATQDIGSYVCVQKVTGSVRLVNSPDECHPSETAGSLPAGLPYAVVDANGQKVGETIQLDGITATVVLTLQNMKFPLQVTTQGFTLTSGLVYSSGDCSGDPYVPSYSTDPPAFPPFIRPVVAVPNATLYVLDTDRTPLPGGTQGSILNPTGPCFSSTLFGGPFPPVKSLVDLSKLGFQLPFGLQ